MLGVRRALVALGMGTSMLAAAATAVPASDIGVKNIVMVHGAWADGSGWRPIYEILKQEGYNVRMVQNPLTSLEADVAATNRVLDRQDGPVILVGHSYGGAVITQAGEHEKVAGSSISRPSCPMQARPYSG